MLQNQQWIFIILCLLFLVFAGYAYTVIPKTRHYFPLNFITVVLVARAFGNLIDRIRLKYVVDFVYISAIDFPVFNVADIYVTVSAVLLFVYLIFSTGEEDFCLSGFKKERTVAMEIFNLTTSEQEKNLRLDKYLSEQLKDISRSYLQN